MSKPRLYVGLRPEPDTGSNDEFMRHLRAFLKCALRSYKIRATVIVVAKPEGDELPAEDEVTL